MKRRIYADTSVIGGCLDVEFAPSSQKLVDRFRSSLDILVLSDLTLAELDPAPGEVREVLATIPLQNVERVGFDLEASRLADEYVRSEVIGGRHVEDSQHIATATVARVDILVSWNFKHIVNLSRIRGYNSVNMRLGFPLLEIRTPQEVLPDED